MRPQGEASPSGTNSQFQGLQVRPGRQAAREEPQTPGTPAATVCRRSEDACADGAPAGPGPPCPACSRGDHRKSGVSAATACDEREMFLAGCAKHAA